MTTTTTTTMTPAEMVALLPARIATKWRGRQPLLEAYARGTITLPGAVEAALAAIARGERTRRDLVEADPGAARNAYSEQVLIALRSGAGVPDAAVVEDVERTARLHEIRRVAVDAARQVFADALESALADGDKLVAGNLRPVLAEMHAEASELLGKHGPIVTGPADAVVSKPAAVGQAWSRFGTLASEIQGLRGVQAALTETTCGNDSENHFGVIREDPRDNRIWGASFGLRHRTKDRPWPTGDARAYQGWLLTSGLEVWAPTGPERDARWREVFGEPRRGQPTDQY